MQPPPNIYCRCPFKSSWGWRRTDLGLLSIINTKDPAPSEILKTVSCKSTKEYTGKCSCRKVGMKCSTICLNCNGQSCSNSALFEDEDVTFIAEEAEIGEDSPFEDDDPDEEDRAFRTSQMKGHRHQRKCEHEYSTFCSACLLYIDFYHVYIYISSINCSSTKCFCTQTIKNYD
ncbi:hypothetical protein JTB14_015718 [Gonioctena quinquepunctata]|nr:hypothetical protein JTB14_015718 [Gonioctena quinquepunctata]